MQYSRIALRSVHSVHCLLYAVCVWSTFEEEGKSFSLFSTFLITKKTEEERNFDNHYTLYSSSRK